MYLQKLKEYKRKLTLFFKDALYRNIALLFFAYVFIAVVGTYKIGEAAVVFFLGILAGGLVIIQLKIYQKLVRSQDKLYRQVESLFSLFSLIKIKSPLPPMRGWAISPDTAAVLVSEILERKPKLVIDLGSGASTIVIAYALKEIGAGKVMAFDHNEKYARETRGQIAKHKLTDFAEVIYVPLKEIDVKGESFLWYSQEPFQDIEKIDILVVDGPPLSQYKMTRYPALPLLYNKLDDGALIAADDCYRTNEKKMILKWLNVFPDLKHYLTAPDKEAVFLIKNSL